MPARATASLATIVSCVRQLGHSESLLLVRTSRTAESERTFFVLCRSAAGGRPGSDYTLAVCSHSSSLESYHPSRFDPTTGTAQHATPLLLRDIPASRVCDGAFWYFALLADAKVMSTAQLYEKLMPYLNSKPLMANFENAKPAAAPQPAAARRGGEFESDDSDGGWGDLEAAPAAAAPAAAALAAVPARTLLGERAPQHWQAPPRDGSGDPHSYDLACLAATVAVQLGCEDSEAVVSAMVEVGARYTAAGITLLLRHQLIVAAHNDLHSLPPKQKLPPATLELLDRASRRCSVSSRALAEGAASLGAAELQSMQADVAGFRAAIGIFQADAPAGLAALPPPDVAAEAIRGSPRQPGFSLFAECESVDELAGAQVERPIVMPVDLSFVPWRVRSLPEVSQLLQRTAYACTLLSNQHGLMRDSYALRISLLTHVFLRVLPTPLPPSPPGSAAALEEEEGGGDCFWVRQCFGMSSDTQQAILRWLGLLCRHFAAASLSVPLGRSFDAARMLVFASMAAVLDVVLRLEAADAPTALSQHYGGHVEGAAGGFAMEMRHLERESERGQLLQPR